ncbi:hypothetical protein FS837_003084 [Tulasnella sp. UAMH 9824]|nr:hypothetical protein FS837_003084 [Tulasnella sp. UAMH 9824]
MKALYPTRMVSRTWRDAIDSTPLLWNVVSSSVPLRVNITAIQRSCNCPLNIYLTRHTLRYSQIDYNGFLELVAKEIGRWSIGRLYLRSPDSDVYSQYFTSPAPLLRHLRVSSDGWEGPLIPVTLFSGIAPRLEDLEIDAVPIDWTPSFIHGLKDLSILNMTEAQLSTQQVLDILASIPSLENLGLCDSTFDHHLQSSQARPALIQFPSLKGIELRGVNTEAAEIILSSIQAPNCLSLAIVDGGSDEIGPSSFYESALSHFNDFQRLTLSSNDVSVLYFFDETMEWECRSTSRLEFELAIPYNTPAIGVEWITRVIGLGTQEVVHTLEVLLNHGSLSDDDLAAYYSFARCQSVTKLRLHPDHMFAGPIIELLGTWRESDDGTGRLPAFPGLKVLVLGTSEGWTLDDLEVLVSRRFGERDDSISQKIPDLKIIFHVSQYSDYDPRPKPDVAQLQRLRAAKGVENLTRDRKHPAAGMLAVVYEDDVEL